MASLFGVLPDGSEIHEVVLRSQAGAEARIIEFGAVLRDLVVPVAGQAQRVVLGFPKLDDYLQHSPHCGAIAGRFANRIAGGRFRIDGREFQLSLNQDNRHSLHGGGQGFGKKPWKILHHDTASVTLALASHDDDAGYPGHLVALCRYTLAEPATLVVELTATTDKPTIVNLCQHSYFRLDGSDTILDHELAIDADQLTPVDGDLIPTGEIAAVAGTPFDFRRPRPIRHPEMQRGLFYDHNFVLTRRRTDAGGLAHAATMRSPRNGLALETWTTEPGLQVYAGHKVAVPVAGHDGQHYGANAGICFEAQRFPDAPNHAHFPSAVLRPGEVYRQRTEYRFIAAD